MVVAVKYGFYSDEHIKVMDNVEFPIEYKHQDLMIVSMSTKTYEKLE